MKSMLFHVFMSGNIPGCAPEVSVDLLLEGMHHDTVFKNQLVSS
jgi:hypothetical protein